MPKKETPASDWPHAPARQAEREKSSRKLRVAREIVAPIINESGYCPKCRDL